MILSQTPIETIDARLAELYKGAMPPPLPGTHYAPHWPSAYVPSQRNRLDKPAPARNAPPAAPEPEGGVLRLDQLPTDALRELYEHVSLPFVLKLTCRALRDAGPPRTELRLSFVGQSSWRFQWAYRVGCPFVWNAHLASRLAYHGCTGALMWARAQGLAWDGEATRQAARGGHLDLLVWLVRFNCPFSAKDAAVKAAGRGHLHVLQWLHRNHAVPWDEWVTIAAARNGKLTALQWLREPAQGDEPPRIPCPWNSWCVTNAAMSGHQAVVEWATANGARLRGHAMVAAAEHGHFELVLWMRERNCSMTERTTAAAAHGGWLAILQYLRSGAFPCPWDASTCTMAARHGHLRVLRWAMEQGCPSTFSTWSAAALKGHVHILQWLHAGGHPLQGVSREDLGADHAEPTEALLRTREWLARMRSPWQHVRNAVRARAIARYWQRIAPVLKGERSDNEGHLAG